MLRRINIHPCNRCQKWLLFRNYPDFLSQTATSVVHLGLNPYFVIDRFETFYPTNDVFRLRLLFRVSHDARKLHDPALRHNGNAEALSGPIVT